MKLKWRFVVYLAAVHLIFGGCAYVFLSEHPLWLLAAEGLFALTALIGLRLVRSFFRPLDLVRSGASFLRDGEFSTRFRSTGQPDMDQLVDVYNLMVDTLREERVRSEEQEQLLRKVISESPGGVITLDVDGNISTLNPAAESLLDVSATGQHGRPLADLGTMFARHLADVPLNESRLLILRGRRRVRCQRLAFMDRGFARQFLLLDELTAELHRTEKQAYEKLIRMMSHEVNNTSGAVQSLLQSCLAYRRHLDEADRDDFTRALEVAISRTANLDAFMRGFADVVRLPQPNLKSGDLRPLLEQVGLLFRDRCAAAGIGWRVDIEDGLPPIAFDAVQLEQALMNVVKNAVEAVEGAGEGEVAITAGRRDRRVALTVFDSGPGLDAAVQEQLFTPFYTTKNDGQGIGLTMVQEILLGHGFDFSLENRDEGGGAVFSILC